jgi:hypothetical protein
MSNRVNLVSTKFVNTKQGNATYGFRMYDDEEQEYDNTWSMIPEDDLDVFKKVLEESDNLGVMAMLDFLDSNKEGIYIDSNWYEWEQIEHFFKMD